MTKIDLEETREMAMVAVEDRGADWIYPQDGSEWRHNPVFDTTMGSCRYVRNRPEKGPACIVGHILNQIGELNKAEGFDVPVSQLAVARDRFTLAALRYLTFLQNEQDAGRSWGVSVKKAWESVSRPSVD